jgi:hypothetical protein
VNGCQLQDGSCGGRLEWHHVIKQQRLKREFRFGAWRIPSDETWRPYDRRDNQVPFKLRKTLDQILGDERNRVWLCSAHHERVTNGRLEAPLPDSVYEFAAEFGLTAQLENDLARRNAA